MRRKLAQISSHVNTVKDELHAMESIISALAINTIVHHRTRLVAVGSIQDLVAKLQDAYNICEKLKKEVIDDEQAAKESANKA